jgi:hypothetical protein
MTVIYEWQRLHVTHEDIRGKCFDVSNSALYSTLEKAQERATIDHGTQYPPIEWMETGPCKYKGFRSQEFPDHYYRILIKMVL